MSTLARQANTGLIPRKAIPVDDFLAAVATERTEAVVAAAAAGV